MKSIRYPINDCYACVQGEGVHTGVAMVLLRLQGCDVRCSYCDTKETWSVIEANEVSDLSTAVGSNPKYACLTAEQIAAYIDAHHQGPQWVLITGGEPAQYELQPMVAQLQGLGMKIALETSGTATGHLDAGIDWVCVSPKIDMPGDKPIAPQAMAQADEIKHVVAAMSDIDALENLLAEYHTKPSVQICLQPVSLDADATALCLDAVIQRGWRLSVQVHKFLRVR